jgi:hypothetical protein
LEQAEAIVRDFCGWVIYPAETVTVTVENASHGDLVLPSRFVTDVVSVEHLGEPITGYRLTTAGVLTDVCFPCGPIVVEYTHGFAEVPLSVTRVVQAVGQRIKGASGAGGLKSQRVGPFAETYGAELSDSESAELAPYRQMLV